MALSPGEDFIALDHNSIHTQGVSLAPRFISLEETAEMRNARANDNAHSDGTEDSRFHESEYDDHPSDFDDPYPPVPQYEPDEEIDGD